MTRREVAKTWMSALAYTAYAVIVIGALSAWLGWVGGVIGFVLALAPVVALTFWEAEG